MTESDVPPRKQMLATDPRTVANHGAASSFIRAHCFLFGTLILLTAAFAVPLFALFRFAAGSSLYSHIPLMPLVTAYLLWLRRGTLPRARAGFHILAVVPFGAGLAALVTALAPGALGLRLTALDAHSAWAFAFVAFVWTACMIVLGPGLVRATLLPLALLVFMVPFPTAFEAAIETGLQYASAEAAYGLFWIAGTPLWRDGLVFHLPGIVLEVAPECSGIHSTLVLFIVSLVAGDMFLRRRWTRATLALTVIPLGIVRNGFRVFTLGQLCVYDDPEWIHSPLHHRGGPIFFALSLIPLFILLYFLWRSDRRGADVASVGNTELKS